MHADRGASVGVILALAAALSVTAACGSTVAGPSGGDGQGGGVKDVKAVDVAKVDVANVDVAKVDVAKVPDVAKPDVGKVADALAPDVAKPDVGQVLDVTVGPDAGCTKSFCANANVLQRCEPQSGTFTTVACDEAACVQIGQANALGCGIGADGTIGCLCSGQPSGCKAADGFCDFGGNAHICNAQSGQLEVATCNETNCANKGLGKSLGCVTSLDTGAVTCECESIVTFCKLEDEKCQGNTLIYCDPDSGKLQTLECTNALCAEFGMGPLIGCQLDSTGLLNCICEF